jgi:hypothetical protein
MLRAEPFFVNRDRSFQKGPRAGMVTFGLKQTRDVIELHRRCGMLGAEGCGQRFGQPEPQLIARPTLNPRRRYLAHETMQAYGIIPFPYQIDFAMYGNDAMDLTSAGLRSMSSAASSSFE